MFDAINGIPLNNSTKGWDVHKSTTFTPEVSIATTDVEVPGRPGHTTVDATEEATVAVIAVITPRERIDELRALFRVRNPVLSKWGTNQVAAATLKSLTLKNQPRADEPFVVVTALFEIPGVWVRDPAVSTSTAVALGSASVDVAVFADITAPVDDAIIRVRGSITDLKVTDSGGSFFRYVATVPTGNYLRFDSTSGRAWLTTTDAWTGGTEVTKDIRHGKPPQYLRILPHFTTDPAVRAGKLTVTSSARSSAQIEVRGRGAYLA